jgi:hypothetical protein
MNVIIAPLGGLIGAILGGVLWAKYIQRTGNTAGFVAISIGALTGIGMLLTCFRTIDLNEKKHWIMVSIAAALFSVIGIFIGKYLDVKWNAITQIAEQIVADEPTMSSEQATSIAKTVYLGSSKLELMRNRMDWFDWIYGAIAVFVAFYITSNRLLRNYFAEFE